MAVTGDGRPSSGILNNFETVVYWENLPSVTIERAAGGVRLRFTGIRGRGYNIERPATVPGPWSILATTTATVDGRIEYIESNPLVGSAVYRTSTP